MCRLYCAPIPKSDDRFARQNRFGLPPEFPLASSCSGIVHHLSGLSAYALSPPRRKRLERDHAAPKTASAPGSRVSTATAPSLSLRLWVSHPMARAYAKLLGPCFKTGRRDDQLPHRDWTPGIRALPEPPPTRTACGQHRWQHQPYTDPHGPGPLSTSRSNSHLPRTGFPREGVLCSTFSTANPQVSVHLA